MPENRIKSLGYLVSIASVFLLVTPSLKSAKQEPLLLACLLAGAAMSILGMALRWHANRKDHAKTRQAQPQGAAALGGKGAAARPGR